jgi:CRP/FNR family transcriptional regulator, cyclic AMP receptor protein
MPEPGGPPMPSSWGSMSPGPSGRSQWRAYSLPRPPGKDVDVLLGRPEMGARVLVTNQGLRRYEIELPAGPLDIHSLTGDRRRCLGLVLADGLITAELAAGRAQVAWLLGAGDLIRPWEMAHVQLAQASEWRALTDARIVRIERGDDPDATAIERVLRWAGRTSQWLLATSLILSSPSIDERLLLLFALYGERWGKVTTDGVRIKLPLTHELLGRLCGARRPTVTLAINSLEENGFITRASHHVWLLHQHPGLADAPSDSAPYEPAVSVEQASIDGSGHQDG